MPDHPTPPAGAENRCASPLPTGRLLGREAFLALVRQALSCAADQGWSSLVLSDPTFEDWPLGERAVVDSLQAWARSGRHIRFLARDFSAMQRLHPRLVRWRVTWSHLVEAHACSADRVPQVPSALWSPGWRMERIDVERCVVVASELRAPGVALRERLDACRQLGRPSFAASTLGL